MLKPSPRWMPARSQQYVRIKDELTWNEFGAPDPGFFDRWIKDNLEEKIKRLKEVEDQIEKIKVKLKNLYDIKK